MDLDALRDALVQSKKRLRITAHAQVEAFKDGLDLADLRLILEAGRVIETYPERSRLLVFGRTAVGALPVHIVVEDTEDEVVIVSGYVPDPKQWIRYVKRKRKPE